MKTRYYRLFAPDNGTNIAQNNNSGNGQASGQNLQSQALTSSDGQASTETPNVDDLLKQIKELRKENAAARNKVKEQDDLNAANLESQLKEQGKYKELAEQHAERVKALEPINERYTTLSQLVSAQIETQIKDWPSEVKAFDPGADSSVEQRLAWLEKSKPLIEKLQLQARSTSPGNTPGPRPVGSSSDDVRGGFENRLRASGKYGA